MAIGAGTMAGLIPSGFEIVRRSGPHLILRTTKVMGIAERGHALMELEKTLRASFNDQLEVFLEPMGDTNALRVRLRGVRVQ